METPNHLGGHAGMTHIDIGALKWAIKTLGVKSARDVGCGTGDMVKHMLDAGLDAYGIEGDPTLNWGRPEKFIRHDYTLGDLNIVEGADLGWCVEVLEHIEEEYLPNVFSTFRDCEFVIVTAAPPGTEAAHHHVNCKDQNYWIAKFFEFGFDFAPDLTAQLRSASTMTRNFMRETGMVFIRNPELDDISVSEETEDESAEWKAIEKSFESHTHTEDGIFVGEIPIDEDEVHDGETISAEDVECDIDLQNACNSVHVIAELKQKYELSDNKDIVFEDGDYFIVTLNKNGTIRKGSKKPLTDEN